MDMYKQIRSQRTFLSNRRESTFTSQMVDLHVLVMPSTLWKDHLKSAENGVIPDTISAGFIRVLPDTRICDLRDEIESQLNDEGIIPNDFVFLKSVGSRVTRVRPKQEVQLKAKAFLYPLNEIFIMENTGEAPYSTLPFSGTSSQRSSRALHHYSDTFRSDKSEFSPHKPIPPIQNGQDPYTSTSAQTGDRSMPPISASPDHAPGAPQDNRGGGSQAGEYLPPLSASPDNSAENSPSHRAAKYTAGTNEDSGISEMEEAEKQKNMDYHIKKQEEDKKKAWEENKKREEEEKRAEEEREREEDEARRKQEEEEEERQRQEEEERQRQEEEERQRQEEEERQRQEEEERQRQEEEERQRQEEEERQRQEEEERQQREWEEEQERKRKEEEEEEEEKLRQEEEERQRRQEEEELERQNEAERNKESTNEELQEQLNQERDKRQDLEAKREELVRRAKTLQQKTQGRRNQARDLWKKRYFEEKKRTAPLEDKANKLRSELDSLHRRIMSQLETQRERDDGRKLKDSKPSHQNNLKIQATKTQHEIEDLQRRTENIKMKLTAEMKLRNQAETELRALRAELTQKKITMSLTRSQAVVPTLQQSAKHELTPRHSEAIMSHR